MLALVAFPNIHTKLLRVKEKMGEISQQEWAKNQAGNQTGGWERARAIRTAHHQVLFELLV